MQNILRFVPAVLGIFFCGAFPAATQAQPPGGPLKIGFVGSLSGFSARYGTAVLEGARLAQTELKARGINVELIVEDDQSNPSQVTSAWQKLYSIDKVSGLIGGTWWGNSIAPLAGRAKMPFLSCETLYNKEWIVSEGYFTLLGDLRDWIRAYEPTIRSSGWKTGAMVKFTSGFADTLEEEMRRVFSSDGRSWLKSIEYSDLDLKEAAIIAAQLKALHPDAVYVDAQPQSLAALIKRLIEQDAGLNIITNMIAKDAVEQRLFDPRAFKGKIYYTERESFNPHFLEKIRMLYRKEPVLNSDLGYYALHILAQSFSYPEPAISAIKAGKIRIGDLQFQFDGNNVYHGVRQKVFSLTN